VSLVTNRLPNRLPQSLTNRLTQHLNQYLTYGLIIFLLPVFFFSCKEDPPVITPPIDTPIDSLYVPDPDPPAYGTPFNGVPATEDVIMYEVNLRAFSPGGDLAGVEARLDSIQSLGINVIWLMPIHPIGAINSVNSPYSVANYKEVGEEYGTLDDLRSLVQAAHERGIAVILDWVANHTAWDNPWMSRPEWYTQVNGEVVHPPGTGWLDVADLNFSNQDMQTAMISALKFWILAANADGYRCDAADYVPYSFWKRALDTLSNMPGRDVMLLAEGQRSDHFTAGFQMNYSWSFYGRVKDAFNGGSAVTLMSTSQSELSGVPATKQKLRFTTNHDESAWDATPVELFGSIDAAFAASVLATTIGGVPLIYGSQEVGRATPLPFFWNTPINWNENPDLLARYRKLLNTYSQSEALKTEALTDGSDEHVVAFRKDAGAESAVVLVNLRETTQTYSVPVEWQGSIWQNALDNQTDTLYNTLDLEGHGVRLLVKP